jgi:hypothetical protein
MNRSSTFLRIDSYRTSMDSDITDPGTNKVKRKVQDSNLCEEVHNNSVWERSWKMWRYISSDEKMSSRLGRDITPQQEFFSF